MPRISYYTTFEISQICEVNPTTVQNWVKEKKLKAFVTPGGHRRIRREDLLEFMERFGMPIPPDLNNGSPVILIVDDEPEMAMMLNTVMKSGSEALEVLSTTSSVDALVMVGERKPDLLILDILMPGMNGFEICRKLKAGAGTGHIKICAISGDHNPTLPGRIRAAGADLFFTKPLNIMEFRNAALELVSLKSRGV